MKYTWTRQQIDDFIKSATVVDNIPPSDFQRRYIGKSYIEDYTEYWRTIYKHNDKLYAVDDYYDIPRFKTIGDTDYYAEPIEVVESTKEIKYYKEIHNE